jgi:RHS repeat-associated protein
VITDATDYFPFGAPNRTVSSSAGYRYGFNGKELDKNNEFGTANVYDYGFRIYNPSIGRFLSLDPLMKSFPWNSPYSFAENDVIRAIDLDGLEKALVVNHYQNRQKMTTAINQVTHECNIINLNAQGNGIKYLPMSSILELNLGDLPDGVHPFEVRFNDFNNDERAIIGAGSNIDKKWIGLGPNTESQGPPRLISAGGFTFHGTVVPTDQTYLLNAYIGQWQPEDIFEDRQVTVNVAPTRQPFLARTFNGIPFGFYPNDGTILGNAASVNPQISRDARVLMNLAITNRVPSLQVVIGMAGNLPTGIQLQNLQTGLARNMGTFYGYTGRIDLRLVNVPQRDGYIRISSANGTILTQNSPQTQTQRVRVGVELKLKP